MNCTCYISKCEINWNLSKIATEKTSNNIILFYRSETFTDIIFFYYGTISSLSFKIKLLFFNWIKSDPNYVNAIIGVKGCIYQDIYLDKLKNKSNWIP